MCLWGDSLRPRECNENSVLLTDRPPGHISLPRFEPRTPPYSDMPLGGASSRNRTLAFSDTASGAKVPVSNTRGEPASLRLYPPKDTTLREYQSVTFAELPRAAFLEICPLCTSPVRDTRGAGPRDAWNDASHRHIPSDAMYWALAPLELFMRCSWERPAAAAA